MNRLFKKVMLIFLVSILVVAFSSSIFAGEKDIVKVRLAHMFPVGSATAMKMEWVVSELEKRSNGRLECELFPGAALGGEKENTEDLLTGNVEITCGIGGVYYQYIPETLILELPGYNWESQEQANRVFHAYWDKLVELSEKKGFYPLALDIYEYYGLWTKKPIKSLKEVAGMKFRAVAADYWIEITKLFGAIPNPLPFSDFYMACKTGVAEGGYGNMQAWVGGGLHEVLKCFIDVRLILGRTFMLTSKKWIDSLPEDLRNIVLEVCKDSENYEISIFQREYEKTKAIMKDAGVTFIEYDQIDKQEIQDLNKKAILFRDEFMKSKGPEVYEFYQNWIKFVEKEKAK